jgi:hypothetical protein
MTETNWILASDELPEYEGRYLVTIRGGRVYLEYFDPELGGWLDIENEIIAWMPLPDPYKPEESDD